MDESDRRQHREDKKAVMEILAQFDAEEIMIPRSRVVILNAASSFGEIIETVSRDGHSRFPVFEEKIDNIIGVLYVKDLLPLFLKEDAGKDFDIHPLLREPMFVSENKRADELLSEFRSRHIHIALVADEYGSFIGIITLEDILEEIVGEIEDEFDKEESDHFKKISDHEAVILPRMQIHDFNRIWGTRLKSERFDTIGGFVIDKFGYVPSTGEETQHRNLTFVVEKSEGSRIKKIRVFKK